MDKELKEYLIKLGLNESQINKMIENVPHFVMLTYELAKENIDVLCEYGFPIEDVDMLIFSNPAILLTSPEDLSEDLASLGSNVEEILKEDPFAI